MPSFVFKLCTLDQWQTWTERGHIDGSPDDQRDGFIHFSTREQVAGTLAKHFAGIHELQLVCFSSADLGADLKWESSRGGALFPHFYGEVPVRLAVWREPVAMDDKGQHRLPERLEQC